MRVVVVLRVVASAFVPHRGHITVRVAGCTLCKVRPIRRFYENEKSHGTPEEVHEVVKGEPSTTMLQNTIKNQHSEIWLFSTEDRFCKS